VNNNRFILSLNIPQRADSNLPQKYKNTLEAQHSHPKKEAKRKTQSLFPAVAFHCYNFH
jgi:hypothetical protein